MIAYCVEAIMSSSMHHMVPSLKCKTMRPGLSDDPICRRIAREYPLFYFAAAIFNFVCARHPKRQFKFRFPNRILFFKIRPRKSEVRNQGFALKCSSVFGEWLGPAASAQGARCRVDRGVCTGATTSAHPHTSPVATARMR